MRLRQQQPATLASSKLRALWAAALHLALGCSQELCKVGCSLDPAATRQHPSSSSSSSRLACSPLVLPQLRPTGSNLRGLTVLLLLLLQQVHASI
jgi:hypothetical protein